VTETPEQELARVKAEFQEFRRLVRQVAYEAKEEEGWCESGVNAKLEKLGLPPKRDFRVPVEVTSVNVRWFNVSDLEVTTQEEAEAFVNLERIERAFGSVGEKGSVRVIPAPDPDETVPGDLDFTYETSETMCGAWDPSRAFTCSRTRGHGGRLHINGDTSRVVATWPNVPARPNLLRVEEFNGEKRRPLVKQPCADGPGCNLCWTRVEDADVAANAAAVQAWEDQYSEVAWVTQTRDGVREPVDESLPHNSHSSTGLRIRPGFADVRAPMGMVLRTQPPFTN
jgi:hypothetical protein